MPKFAISMSAILVVAASAGATQATDNWRKIASHRDEAKIANLADTWRKALGQARPADPHQFLRLGRTLNRTAALPRPYPSPGNYRCRTIKLGTPSEGTPRLLVYDWFRCRVELTPGGDLILTKVNGSQRQRGSLYPHSSRALIFLGTLALSSSERSWSRYGSNPERDVAGVFERIGPNHYRLVIPEPEYESKLDILELRKG